MIKSIFFPASDWHFGISKGLGQTGDHSRTFLLRHAYACITLIDS